jgi:hypothetical protein
MMKKIIFSALLAGLFCISYTQGTVRTPQGPLGKAVSASSGWNGSFTGNISGTASILSIQPAGSGFEGQIDASGYIYLLTGSVQGNIANGKLTDKITGGTMDFAATLQGDILDMKLQVPGQFGQITEIPVQFHRGGQPSATTGNAIGNASEGNIQRDRSLIGGWRNTESYTSGDFGMVSEIYMNISADGTYTYGDGQIAGGDYNTSFESGGNSGHSTGQWKTENQHVYINEGYGWQRYARYYVEGNSMLFTFDDGTKQLWERYR